MLLMLFERLILGIMSLLVFFWRLSTVALRLPLLALLLLPRRLLLHPLAGRLVCLLALCTCM